MSESVIDGVYVVKIVIQNASDTSLNLQSCTLTDGYWFDKDGSGGMPIPGTVLASGGTLIYYNAAANAFSPVGASITFTPSTDGSMVVSWGRQPGYSLAVNGSISSNALTLQCTGINVGTLNPTAQYLTTSISSL